MTMSIVDILDRFFETEQVKTVMALDGLIGTWAGPNEPGTGYVMAHHSIGDVGNGQVGAWATVIGGMGAVAAALEASARSFGAEIRLEAPVERILVANERVRGVALASGEEIAAPIVVAATHPQITFLRQLDASELPDRFVDDIRNWKSRSGTVKINLALDRAPVFTAKPDQADLTGGFELAHSIAYLERAFEEARNGRAATAPFSDGNMPTYADPTLAPEGKHIVSLFTQWCPAEWADDPDDVELEAYADRVIAGYDELAPGSPTACCIARCSAPMRCRKVGAWWGATSSTGSSPPNSSSICARRPGSRTTGRRSPGSTSARARPTPAAA